MLFTAPGRPRTVWSDLAACSRLSATNGVRLRMISTLAIANYRSIRQMVVPMARLNVILRTLRAMALSAIALAVLFAVSAAEAAPAPAAAPPAAPAPVRHPQEEAIERGPKPYTNHDVSFENPAAHIKLGGTFSVPEGKGPFPAVLLIAASGPE